MKRSSIPIVAFASIVSLALLASCGGASTTTYHHPRLGYSVEIPLGWRIVEQPASRTEGGTRSKSDKVHFREGPALSSPWVEVEVMTGKTAEAAIADQWSVMADAAYASDHVIYQTKTKFYWKSRYVVGEPGGALAPSWTDWYGHYYVEHDGRLYIVTFKPESLDKRVVVSLDGWGRVNNPMRR